MYSVCYLKYTYRYIFKNENAIQSSSTNKYTSRLHWYSISRIVYYNKIKLLLYTYVSFKPNVMHTVTEHQITAIAQMNDTTTKVNAFIPKAPLAFHWTCRISPFQLDLKDALVVECGLGLGGPLVINVCQSVQIFWIYRYKLGISALLHLQII